MKYLMPAIFLLCILSANAQKDKTLTWKAPVNTEGNISVSIKSKSQGENFYEGFDIFPATTKPLRLNTSCIGRYGMQIIQNRKIIFNGPVENDKTFLLPVNQNDTISVLLFAKPKIEKPVSFYYAYSQRDTTQVSLSKDPQKAFEQLLMYANTRFANLHPAYLNKSDRDEINYPDGIFATKRAYKDVYGITQYTGLRLDSVAAAKDMAAWNNKLKTWLKDYKITDVKKYNKETLLAKGNYLNDVETEYRKTNAQGTVIFVVTVFRRLDDGGYFTGVNIRNK